MWIFPFVFLLIFVSVRSIFALFYKFSVLFSIAFCRELCYNVFGCGLEVALIRI